MSATLAEKPRAERARTVHLPTVRAVGRTALAWKQEGACFGDNDDTMTPDSHEEQLAVVPRCQLLCPVQEQCLAYALETDQRFGVWGGLTERDLSKLRTQAKT